MWVLVLLLNTRVLLRSMQGRKYIESIKDEYIKRNFSDYFIGGNPKGKQIKVHVVHLSLSISYQLSGDDTYDGS